MVLLVSYIIISLQGGLSDIPLPPPTCRQFQCEHCHILLEGQQVSQVFLLALVFVFVFLVVSLFIFVFVLFVVNTSVNIVICYWKDTKFNRYFRLDPSHTSKSTHKLWVTTHNSILLQCLWVLDIYYFLCNWFVLFCNNSLLQITQLSV